MRSSNINITENYGIQLDYTHLPPELWLHVLSYLLQHELLKTARLSRFFQHLALPVLYEEVHWKLTDEGGLLNESACSKALVCEWEQSLESHHALGCGLLVERVRKCIVNRRSSLRRRNAHISQSTGALNNDLNSFRDDRIIQMVQRSLNPEIWEYFSKSNRVHQPSPSSSVLGALLSMKNLKILVLSQLLIPNNLVTALAEFPYLEEVDIRWCKTESICTIVPTAGPPTATTEDARDDESYEDSSDGERRGAAEVSAHISAHTYPSSSSLSAPTDSDTKNILRGDIWPPSLTRLTLIGVTVAPTVFNLTPGNETTSYHIARQSGLDELYSICVSPNLRYLRTSSPDLVPILEAYERALTSQRSSDPEQEDNGDDAPLMHPSQLQEFRISFCSRDRGANRLVDFLDTHGAQITHLEIANTTSEESQELSRLLDERSSSMLLTRPTIGVNIFLPSLQSYNGPSCLAVYFLSIGDVKEMDFQDCLGKLANDSAWRDGNHDGLLPIVTAAHGHGSTIHAVPQSWSHGESTTNVGVVQQTFNQAFNPGLSMSSNNVFVSEAEDHRSMSAISGATGSRVLRPDARNNAIALRLEREVELYLSGAFHRAMKDLLPYSGMLLEKLSLSIVRWDIDLLWMIVNITPQLLSLEIRCLREGPDSQFFMSFWGHFLHLMPNLMHLYIYDLSKPSLPILHAEPSEQGIPLEDQKLALFMTSRARPTFSSFSMTRAIVWIIPGHRTEADIRTGRGWGYVVRDPWRGVLGDDPLVNDSLKHDHEREKEWQNEGSDGEDGDGEQEDEGEEEKGHRSMHRQHWFSGRGKTRPQPPQNEGSSQTIPMDSLPFAPAYALQVHPADVDDPIHFSDASGDEDMASDDGWSFADMGGFLRLRGDVGRRITPSHEDITILHDDDIMLSDPHSAIHSHPELVPNSMESCSSSAHHPSHSVDPLLYEGSEMDGMLESLHLHSSIHLEEHLSQGSADNHSGHSSYASPAFPAQPDIALSNPSLSRPQSLHSTGLNVPPSRHDSLDDGLDYDDYEELAQSTQSLSHSDLSRSIQSSYPPHSIYSSSSQLSSQSVSHLGTLGTPASAFRSYHAFHAQPTTSNVHHSRSQTFFEYQYGTSPYDSNPYDGFDQLCNANFGNLYNPKSLTSTGYDTDNSFYDTRLLYDGVSDYGRSRAGSLSAHEEAQGHLGMTSVMSGPQMQTDSFAQGVTMENEKDIYASGVEEDILPDFMWS
ncbi:hypothetical protein FRC18_012213 [Serendipita sp. 400]|nr:hypothetical protein FRC18_012213 [Serendipita sp. 400]